MDKKSGSLIKKMFNRSELNLSSHTSSLSSTNLTREFTESLRPGEFVVVRFSLGLFSFVGIAENVAVVGIILTK